LSQTCPLSGGEFGTASLASLTPVAPEKQVWRGTAMASGGERLPLECWLAPSELGHAITGPFGSLLAGFATRKRRIAAIVLACIEAEAAAPHADESATHATPEPLGSLSGSDIDTDEADALASGFRVRAMSIDPDGDVSLFLDGAIGSSGMRPILAVLDVATNYGVSRVEVEGISTVYESQDVGDGAVHELS
jgi:hypothetical protein